MLESLEGKRRAAGTPLLDPNALETADHLRESSTRRWGVPSEMWKEAREFRKLSQGIKHA